MVRSTTVLVLSLLVLPRAADAKPEPIAGTTPWSQTTHVGLEFDVTLFGPGLFDDLTGLSWVITGQGEVVDNLFLGGRVGLGYYVATEGFGGSTQTFGQATYSNIPVSVHYARTVVKDVLALHVGGRIAAPLLADPDGGPLGASYLMTFMRAGWAPDTFVPLYVPIRLGGGLEAGGHAGSGAALVRFELDPNLWAPIYGSNVHFYLDTAAEGEWRHTSGAGAGLRLQGVFSPTADGGQGIAQLAIEPFVGFIPEGLPVYARFGGLVALNEPLGAVSGRVPLTSFRISIGWKMAK